MQLKTHIEALLFLTDKPLKAQVIARTLNQDVQAIRQAMLELINDYETRNGALEIADEDGYMMQVKDEFSALVDELAPFEMPTALVRTLSAIALKQPVSQADVIKIRGAGAYDHIKELEIRELIHRQEDGRSPILTTTKKFQEYFRLSKDGQGWRQELSTATKAAKDEAAGEGNKIEAAEAAAVQLDVFDASPDTGTDRASSMMGDTTDVTDTTKLSDATDAADTTKLSDATDVGDPTKLSDATVVAGTTKLSDATDVADTAKLSDATNFADGPKLSDATNVAETKDVTDDTDLASSDQMEGESISP